MSANIIDDHRGRDISGGDQGGGVAVDLPIGVIGDNRLG
jgi:hypothetical protein